MAGTSSAELTPEERAQRVLAANSYLTLATADQDGRPWASPVWFAARGGEEFFWVSRPEARHSQNIAGNPLVGIVVFDSSASPADAAAVYVEAVAAEVSEEDRSAALEVYSARSEAQGLPPWTAAEVTGEAKHRLYRATATQVYVLGSGDSRVALDRLL